LNGVTLRPGDDYTATNGTSVVLNVAAALNDDLMVIAFAVFNVANAVAKTGDTMTGSLLLPAGTVSAPALTTSADTNTGMFFPAADTVAIATGGTEKVRVNNSGTVSVTGSVDVTRSGGTVSTLTQTSATGYGLTIIPGADTNYQALTINNAANTLNNISMYGDGTAQFAKTIGVGGATPSTSGAGITFPATQSASSNANTLDDYEEGTFTPVVRGSGTAGTYQATNSGQYTKVGNIVTVNVVIQLGTITGGGTGYLQMTGFPFTNQGSSTGAVQSAGLDMTTNYTWLTAMPVSDSTTIWYLSESGDNQAPSDFPISGVVSADVFRFTATYRAA